MEDQSLKTKELTRYCGMVHVLMFAPNQGRVTKQQQRNNFSGWRRSWNLPIPWRLPDDLANDTRKFDQSKRHVDACCCMGDRFCSIPDQLFVFVQLTAPAGPRSQTLDHRGGTQAHPMSSVTSEKRCVFSWHTLLAYGQALETQTSLLHSDHSSINVFYNQLSTFHLIFFHLNHVLFTLVVVGQSHYVVSTKKRSGRSTAPCCGQLAVRRHHVCARCWSHSS